VTAQGGVLVPFYRESFVFDLPAVELYRVGAVDGFARVGLGIRFP
jgi:hypothetical protein